MVAYNQSTYSAEADSSARIIDMYYPAVLVHLPADRDTVPATTGIIFAVVPISRRRILGHLPNLRPIKVEQDRHREQRRCQEAQQTSRPINTKRMIPAHRSAEVPLYPAQKYGMKKVTHMAVAKSGNPAPNPLLTIVFPAMAELAYIVYTSMM